MTRFNNPFRRFSNWLRGLYSRRRDTVLSASPSIYGLAPGPETKAFGIVVDLGHPTEIKTVAALACGKAELFCVGRSGFPRNFSAISVSQTAKDMVSLANDLLGDMALTGAIPVPADGMVHIQVLTSNGVYSGTAVWQEVLEQKNVYTRLYELAWRLLHELESVSGDMIG